MRPLVDPAQVQKSIATQMLSAHKERLDNIWIQIKHCNSEDFSIVIYKSKNGKISEILTREPITEQDRMTLYELLTIMLEGI